MQISRLVFLKKQISRLESLCFFFLHLKVNSAAEQLAELVLKFLLRVLIFEQILFGYNFNSRTSVHKSDSIFEFMWGFVLLFFCRFLVEALFLILVLRYLFRETF
jgi:hypothetical protein